MDVLLVTRLGAVDARLFAADAFQRPRAAAGYEYKPGERCKRERFVERFHQRPGAYFRPARREIEKRSIAQIEPRRDPEVEESIDARPPDHRRHGALIGDDKGQRIGSKMGRYRRAVPQREAESGQDPLVDMREQ